MPENKTKSPEVIKHVTTSEKRGLITSQNLHRIIKEKAMEQFRSIAKLIHVVTVYGLTCGQAAPSPPRFTADAPYYPQKAKK